ncbi:MAG: hypothetical protein ACE5D3_05845, partial [Candidatus Binatia bacterium]
QLLCPTPCPPDAVTGPPCSSAEFFAAAGSDLDTGWTGLGHNADLIEGASVTIRMPKECGDGSPCLLDSDCSVGTCDVACDCDDPNNSVCNITGPTHQGRCLTSLTPCTSNSDCGSQTCERFFGPPLPLSSAGVPVCVTTFFASDITGTADAQTGTGVASFALRSRVHLGILNDQPCPRCGALSSDPQIGDTFTCEGGPNDGGTCVVEAVSPDFGGVSSACPPETANNVSGTGLAIRFNEATTGTVSRTAQLPCNGIDFQICTDTFAPCSSNADCTNGPAGNKASCNFFCHCGFCDGDADLPCMEDQDCPQGTTCVVGPGTESANAPQELNNQCTNGQCGQEALEECHDTVAGECSDKDFLSCSSDSQCQNQGAGTCVFKQKPCFENTITRTGTPSPLGKYCVDDPNNNATCTNDADCAVGSCVDDSSKPTTVALFCVPATSSSAINNAAGTTGPGAITFESKILVCRCGDSSVGCDEQCDDGNDVNGDGCDENCQLE